jgi:hypothetical protein
MDHNGVVHPVLPLFSERSLTGKVRPATHFRGSGAR